LIPGKKDAYRIYGKNGAPLLDVLLRHGEAAPKVDEQFLCRHPFSETKRAYVTPSRVEPLLKVVWDGAGEGLTEALPTIEEGKNLVRTQLEKMREDHLRYVNPTPYKVSVSQGLYEYFHELWSENSPIQELS